MTNPKLAAFQGKKYLNLETFKRDGTGVKTPIWFAEATDGIIYAYTLADSWKVKRVRNNPRVRIAPCDIRGNVIGTWIEGTARLLQPGEPEFDVGDKLLDGKYALKRLFNWTTKLRKRKRTGIAISVWS